MAQSLIFILVLLPLAGAALVYPLRRRSQVWRDRYVWAVPAAVLLCALGLLAFPGEAALPGVCGFGLRFSSGSFQSLMCLMTAFLWMMTALASEAYFKATDHVNRFYCFWLLTLGALMGVFLASDLFTLFVFFEIMSFTSYVWVAWPETPGALRAGQTYLAIAVFGGMAVLVGLLWLEQLLGTLEFSAMAELAAALTGAQRSQLLAACCFCLVGFGAKAGMFPLHIWLPKAHPVAPAPASALLSGILTKSGIFGILILSRYLLRGDPLWNGTVLALGTVTMVLGAVLALFSVDLKRTLACSSMSQIGFILLGVAMQGFLGEENALAAWGTVLHILNHGLIKLVLFVAAGVVYLGCHHKLNLNEIRGWGRSRPWLKATFFVAAVSIAGVPGTSGYVSKTLLHESLVEQIHLLEQAGANAGAFRAVEWLFLLSGGLTAAYMARLFVCIFVERRPSGGSVGVQYPQFRSTRVALLSAAAILAVLGLTPGYTMEPIARWAGDFLRAGEGHAVHYFAWANLQGSLISLAIGAVIYFGAARTVLQKKTADGPAYPDLWPKWLDLEERIYRPALRCLSFLGALAARCAASVGDWLVLAGEKLLFTRAPAVFEPKRNPNFGAYGKKPRRFLVTETFSFDLLLGGMGLVSVLAYLLLK